MGEFGGGEFGGRDFSKEVKVIKEEVGDLLIRCGHVAHRFECGLLKWVRTTSIGGGLPLPPLQTWRGGRPRQSASEPRATRIVNERRVPVGCFRELPSSRRG